MTPRIVVSADDFGLSLEVNEAVELAHRQGMLSTASLMVAGPAAADAVRRARLLPELRVGLHLVVIEGPSVLGPPFGSDQLRLGVQYYFSPAGRRRLQAEIAAQYRAFAATGLTLDHANAHKHMHLHPTVGRLLIETGRAFGLRAMRVPAEPPSLMRACGVKQGSAARALYVWTRLLRRQGARAGLLMNDWVAGIAWSGSMTKQRLLRLATHLPPGLGEIYFHPATRQTTELAALMPGYDHPVELAALMDPELRATLAARAEFVTWVNPRRA